MRNLFSISIILVILLANFANSSDIKLSYKSPLEQKTLEDFRLNQLDRSQILSAWLISGGVDDSLTLAKINNRYKELCNELEKEIDIEDDINDNAEEIFDYLHKKILKIPKDNTHLDRLFLNGEYNILTASALYYLLCQKFNIPAKLLSSYMYIIVHIVDNDRIIPVEIIDKKKGFNKKINNRDLVDLFIKMEFIQQDELDKLGYELIIDKYLNFYETISPFKLMAIFYHNAGVQSIALGEYEIALQYYEKALLVDPENEMYLQNYKFVLYNLNDILNPYEKFLSYYKNALWFLKDDPTFTGVAILMANKFIQYYVDDQKDHQRALDLIWDLKISYMNDRFIANLSKYEKDIYFDLIWTLSKRGNYSNAYQKCKTLYFNEKNLPKYKDAYVEISKVYIYNLLQKYKDYTRAIQIMDTLFVEAGDYPIVQDMYISVLLAPINEGYRYIENNLSEAYKLAHKAYKVNPQHQLTKFAISQVYHYKAMVKIRANKLADAHRILVEGLKYSPKDRLLLEDLDQVEEAY